MQVLDCKKTIHFNLEFGKSTNLVNIQYLQLKWISKSPFYSQYNQVYISISSVIDVKIKYLINDM